MCKGSFPCKNWERKKMRRDISRLSGRKVKEKNYKLNLTSWNQTAVSMESRDRVGWDSREKKGREKRKINQRKYFWNVKFKNSYHIIHDKSAIRNVHKIRKHLRQS